MLRLRRYACRAAVRIRGSTNARRKALFRMGRAGSLLNDRMFWRSIGSRAAREKRRRDGPTRTGHQLPSRARGRLLIKKGRPEVPVLQRDGEPDLYYELDDYTDPWLDAPYMLLQHGFGRSSKFWYRCVPYLARFYRIIRPDLRGFGRSAPSTDPADEFTIAACIRDFEAILDALGIESVHYCGESLGGILGMPFAAERARRVRTLTLISSRVRLNQSSRERYRFGHGTWEEALVKLGPRAYAEAKNTADRFAPGTDPGLMNWFAEQQGSSRVESLGGAQRLGRDIDTTPYLSRIEAPVLAIYPSHGPITTPEQEDLLREHVRDLRLVHLPSEYHNLHLTQAAACAAHLLHFAAQYDGRPCREP
jgi:3-oxoadipate enol-lactonase